MPELHLPLPSQMSPTVQATSSLQVAPTARSTTWQAPVFFWQMVLLQAVSPVASQETTVAGFKAQLQALPALSQYKVPLQRSPSSMQSLLAVQAQALLSAGLQAPLAQVSPEEQARPSSQTAGDARGIPGGSASRRQASDPAGPAGRSQSSTVASVAVMAQAPVCGWQAFFRQALSRLASQTLVVAGFGRQA